MSKVCVVTGKKHERGNNVSHSQRKTRRSFKPNVHKKRFWSEKLQQFISLLVTPKGAKTLDKWGVDAFLSGKKED